MFHLVKAKTYTTPSCNLKELVTEYSMSSETITKKFSSAFDSKNKEHVMWFKHLYVSTIEEKSVDRVLYANPFGIKVSKNDCLEWVNIQFILAMKYSTSVLDGRAWVPVQEVI
jgi:hypothetical protein